jgi:hypothetical protein
MSLKQDIKAVEKAGFEVKKRLGLTEKHTFEVPVVDLKEFFIKCRVKGLKIKEAVAEAIRDWNLKS